MKKLRATVDAVRVDTHASTHAHIHIVTRNVKEACPPGGKCTPKDTGPLDAPPPETQRGAYAGTKMGLTPRKTDVGGQHGWGVFHSVMERV